MAITLDKTLGGSGSNSYVDAAYCDDYWSNHYNTTLAQQVLALSTAQQNQLLVRACRSIESLRFTRKISSVNRPNYRYSRSTGTVIDANYLTQDPVRSNPIQALQFPRNIDIDEEGNFEIPEAVMMAQCEQLAYLLNFDETAMANRLQGVTMDKLGLGQSQIDLTQEYASTGSMIAPAALEMIRPYLIRYQKVQRA